MTLTVGSLFSGIGGLDLGLERAGMRVIWQAEIDNYSSRILKKHWKETPNLGNVTEIDWRDVIRPNVICAGYPCQPFSISGHRRGEHDPRHLFPYVLEAISVLRPEYAILENVRGHLSLGGLSVVGQLAEAGYDSEWSLVSAASLGGAHIRDRLFIISYANRDRETTRSERQNISTQDQRRTHDRSRSERDPREERLESTRQTPRIRFEQYRQFRDDTRKTEPGIPRVAHGIPHRLDRVRGLGNAVVPYVAEFIGSLVIQDHKKQEGEPYE